MYNFFLLLEQQKGEQFSCQTTLYIIKLMIYLVFYQFDYIFRKEPPPLCLSWLLARRLSVGPRRPRSEDVCVPAPPLLPWETWRLPWCRSIVVYNISSGVYWQSNDISTRWVKDFKRQLLRHFILFQIGCFVAFFS